ncbi:MAG: hypothetical protein FJX71_03635 [Alphaproteobacteria bacterium]|nr:hypothetical protein [Alphaproteobacteria bacterium]
MRKLFIFILLILVSFSNSHANDNREYILSNMGSLIKSFSTVDFTQSSKEEVDKLKYRCAIKMNEFNKGQSKELEKILQQFQDHKISEDKFLQMLLDMRFRNINFFHKHQGFKLKPNNSIAKQFQGVGNLTIVAGNMQMHDIGLIGSYVKFVKGSSSEGFRLSFIDEKEKEIREMFDTIISEAESTSEAEVRSSFTTLVNDNLFVLTRLILAVFSLKSPNHFTDVTLEYVRASKSLWPLLAEVGRGADPFLIDDEAYPFDDRTLIDEYELYATCLLNIYVKKERFKGLGCRETDIIDLFSPLKECDQIDGTWELPILPKSFYATKAQLARKLRHRQAKIGRALQPPAPGNFPKNPMLQVPIASSLSSLSTSPSSSAASSSSSSSSVPPVSIASAVSSSSSAVRAAVTSTIENDEGLSIDIDDTSDLNDNELDNDDVPSPSDDISSLNEGYNPNEEHVFARWNRKLHPHKIYQDISIGDKDLGRHLKTLRKIFEGSKRVSYQKFESLWFHINEEFSIKKKSKSSHRALLNKEGRVVGGTFVLNGGRHQYDSNQLEELQDALTLVGYGQKYLDAHSSANAILKGKKKL